MRYGNIGYAANCDHHSLYFTACSKARDSNCTQSPTFITASVEYESFHFKNAHIQLTIIPIDLNRDLGDALVMECLCFFIGEKTKINCEEFLGPGIQTAETAEFVLKRNPSWSLTIAGWERHWKHNARRRVSVIWTNWLSHFVSSAPRL